MTLQLSAEQVLRSSELLIDFQQHTVGSSTNIYIYIYIYIVNVYCRYQHTCIVSSMRLQKVHIHLISVYIIYIKMYLECIKTLDMLSLSVYTYVYITLDHRYIAITFHCIAFTVCWLSACKCSCSLGLDSFKLVANVSAPTCRGCTPSADNEGTLRSWHHAVTTI